MFLALVALPLALAAGATGPAAKMERLLEDVQETISKNAADETIVRGGQGGCERTLRSAAEYVVRLEQCVRVLSVR